MPDGYQLALHFELQPSVTHLMLPVERNTVIITFAFDVMITAGYMNYKKLLSLCASYLNQCKPKRFN